MLQHPLLSYAFRPFFLVQAVFAIVAMLLWMLALRGSGPDVLPVNIVYWHGHEMLVGFAMAAIAGFALTAVATWTNRPPVQGGPLLLLVACWLAGRLAMGFGGALPAGWVAAVDMLFPLLLLVLMAREVLLAKNKRNYPILLIMLLLAGFNGLYHAGLLGWLPLSVDAQRIGLYLLLHLVLLLIAVVAGRIVPNFTANWLRAEGQREPRRLPNTGGMVERIVVPLTLLTGLWVTVLPLNDITGVLALATAGVHAVRLARWCGLATRGEPLLLVLHAAYGWLPAGYLLTALAVFGVGVPATAALHALTVGGISFMILAVSTRVALAHTGRVLHAARLTVLAYLLLMVAAIVRVLSPFGSAYLTLLDIAALAWVLTFLLFLWVYYPVLTKARVDAEN